MEKTSFVSKCLKMPHSQAVGYYNVDGEKIYCALAQHNERYFDIDQKDIVEDNYNKLTLDKFVELPRAVVNESEFIIGDSVLVCSVLNDGRRVVKDKSLFGALARIRKGEVRIDGFPPIIGSKTLANLFNELYPENIHVITPFDVAQFNGKTGKWYDANAIPVICDLYMAAEEKGYITPQQDHVLKQAKILLRSLAKVGITALIDEATNYQDIRGKDELQLLLAKFISEELRPYSKEFHKEYFENLFRIYGLPYDPTSQKRPRFFALFNIKYVYEMLPPKVWSRLDEINPTVWNEERQRADRKHHIHRNLTDEGLRYLREHLQQLIPVMKLSSNKEDFVEKFNLVFSDKLRSLEEMKKEGKRIEEGINQMTIFNNN
ncbi:P63C domain-containing protein [Clostridium sp. HMP27]|uniref:P63C domain-containing protein n=1 Tax=Clostridium sp. HMP27 TaxID=1487921 RepID=UPI00052D7D63|nr:P63C domain-containing protein [Clostridium sp. HMP27]KGK88592.1 hypothetical protein DP68_07015 [Clostridium sp. HMP27]